MILVLVEVKDWLQLRYLHVMHRGCLHFLVLGGFAFSLGSGFVEAAVEFVWVCNWI